MNQRERARESVCMCVCMWVCTNKWVKLCECVSMEGLSREREREREREIEPAKICNASVCIFFTFRHFLLIFLQSFIKILLTFTLVIFGKVQNFAKFLVKTHLWATNYAKCCTALSSFFGRNYSITINDNTVLLLLK